MNRYPSDQELERFLENLEREELYAPAHLKEEILRKAAQTERNEKSGGRKSPPFLFPVYTLKMIAGMAAAVCLVFLIPAQDAGAGGMAGTEVSGGAGEEDRERISLDERLCSFLEEKREAAAKWEEKTGGRLILDSLGGIDDDESKEKE